LAFIVRITEACYIALCH